tara:strand:- start:445 stop:798 length:354 start_codon:yes stop_codon:yes gene_type:complete
MKMKKLTIRIPTKDGNGDHLDQALTAGALDSVEAFFVHRFGGCEFDFIRGSYLSDDGDIIREQIIRASTFGIPLNEDLEAFDQLAKELAQLLQQEAILYTVEYGGIVKLVRPEAVAV